MTRQITMATRKELISAVGQRYLHATHCDIASLNTHTLASLYETFAPDSQGAVGSLRVRLHAQARQLAKYG